MMIQRPAASLIAKLHRLGPSIHRASETEMTIAHGSRHCWGGLTSDMQRISVLAALHSQDCLALPCVNLYVCSHV